MAVCTPDKANIDAKDMAAGKTTDCKDAAEEMTAAEREKSAQREKRITRVTLWGSAVNLVLTAMKIAAGTFGRSAAMIADGVHSLSDLMSDIVVLVFIRISSKDKDREHEFGHGKFETLATAVVSLILVVVSAKLISGGIGSIKAVIGGAVLPKPGWIALAAAAISIIAKEIVYRVTAKVGREVDSPVTVANAWHHRSDAMSSIGSLLAIGGAIALGQKWTVLDPIASCIIGVMIVIVAVKMAVPSLQELLDVSLPEETEKDIIEVIESVEGVRSAHGLKTRRNGPSVIIEAHLVVDPESTVDRAHNISTEVEHTLRTKYGIQTQISLHVEPSADAE